MGMCAIYARMGAIARATVDEVEELVGGDPAWWSDFLSRVVEVGPKVAMDEACRLRGWALSALWGWVMGDDGRKRDFQESQNLCVGRMAWETVGIADASEDAKLRVDTRFRIAGKVDRERWGEKVDHIGVMLDPFSEMLREISQRRLAAMREPVAMPAERVIEAVASDEIEEI